MLTIEGIARVCHEANRAYCEGLGDTSVPTWEDAPAWQRETVIDGVVFHQRNAHARPSASHENWLAAKEAAGWTFGEVKDPEAKTHPCMVPFGELPVEQQRKDYLFKFICDALLPMVETNEADGETNWPQSETESSLGDVAPSFELVCSGPEYDALMEILPEGAEVRPYAIDEGDGPKTMHLRPASAAATKGGFFRMIFDGWIVASLPSGSAYVVGFEVDYEDGIFLGRPVAESKGREDACRTLREHIASGTGDDALEVMENGGYLPRAGQIKVRRAPLAEGATG